MVFDMETIIYLTAGIIVIGLYIKRQKEWAKLNEDVVPEIDKKVFYELKDLLKKSYQRGLYLGFSFLYLAYITFMRGMPQAKIFGIILTLGLFFYNIPPRNKVMKILTDAEIDYKTLSQRGIKL